MDDQDFIPKLSGVRSKHDSTESGHSGNQSKKHEGDSKDSEKAAAEQADTGRAAATAADQTADAGEQSAADRTAADLSAAALAIEMTAVSSFDSLPVTNVTPNPQSFSDLVMPETKPQLSASHLNPEFGYHGGIREPKDQPLKPPSVMPPPPKSVVQYNQQIADEQPSPIDSLIKQSDELDSIWTLHSEPTSNEPRQNANQDVQSQKQPARPTPFENNTDTKILFAPDGYGAASMTPLSPQQASLELPEMNNAPVAVGGTPTGDVDDRKQRAASVRSSLYWVVKEARLVTHGAFADYEPPRPTNSDTTILKQPARSRVTAENSVIYEEPPAAQVPPSYALKPNAQDSIAPNTSAPEPMASKTNAPNTVVPPAPARTSPTPPSVVNAFTEGNFDPTVKVSGNNVSKSSNEPLSPTGNPDPVKPEVSITHRPGSLTPVQKSTQEVTGERRLEPAGARNQSLLQRTAGQRRLEEGTTSDGTIKLPIIGTVKRETLKKQAVTLGSVLVLCIASAIVMYDTIIAGRDTTKEQEPGESKDGSGKSILSATKNDLSNGSNSADGALATQTSGANSNASKDVSSAPITDTTEDLAKAFKLEQQQNYIASMELFDKIIEIDKGENPKSLHGRGRVCTKLQLYDKALNDLETADKLDPRNVNILIDLAAVRYLRSEYIDSAKEYEHILVEHPDDVDALYGRGISYAGIGKHESAISDFEKVVKLKPTYDKAYRQMCTAYLAMGQPDKAESAITQAMKTCGADADLYFSRALSRYQQGRKEASLDDYNDAIRLSPDRKEYYNDRGYVLKEIGKLDEAKRDFQTALELDPKYKLAADNLRKLRKLEHSAKSGH